jgi:hypothetical protein
VAWRQGTTLSLYSIITCSIIKNIKVFYPCTTLSLPYFAFFGACGPAKPPSLPIYLQTNRARPITTAANRRDQPLYWPQGDFGTNPPQRKMTLFHLISLLTYYLLTTLAAPKKLSDATPARYCCRCCQIFPPTKPRPAPACTH